jgi:transcriptional regulator CtsR
VNRVANLADDIEGFLKSLLRENGLVELQRVSLALQFGCAPSQINYVLATRFTPERGYLVESRRGGGGYLRVIRLNLESGDSLHELIHQQIGSRLSQDEANGYIDRLREQGVILEREAGIMRAAVDRETLRLELPLRDTLRANLLKSMILAILRF